MPIREKFLEDDRMSKNPHYPALVKKLKKAQKSVREEDNPKLYQQMSDLINGDNWETVSDFNIAMALDTADLSKSLPKEIADIMAAAYLSAAETNENNERGVAYNNLGVLYYSGRAGCKDYEKSLHFYQLADQEGYRLASENLAYCYYYGMGAETDYEKAYYYFSKAAIAGRYESMYKLGDMFRYGYYVDKDEDMVRTAYIKAEYMMKQAWDTMDTDGLNYGSVYMRLGDMYFEGIGTAKNDDKAYECYQRAERGFYEQMRHGSHYNKKDLQRVNERLVELKAILMERLPKLDWI